MKKQLKGFALLSLVVIVLVNLPFLPGPSSIFLYKVAHGFYDVGCALTVVGLPFLVLGVITMIAFRKEKRNERLGLAVYCCAVPLIFLSATLLSGLFRNMSRNMAIAQANHLISDIEAYQARTGSYPEDLESANIHLPSAKVIGAGPYEYQKFGDDYTVTFTQNVLMNSHYEVVTFDKTGNRQFRKKHPKCYATHNKYWKYYVYN